MKIDWTEIALVGFLVVVVIFGMIPEILAQINTLQGGS